MKLIANALGRLNIDFLAKVRYTFFISIILIVISVYSLSTQWLNLGLDFTGGAAIEMQADKAIDTEAIRKQLIEDGYPDAQVIEYGAADTIQIKLPPSDKAANEIASHLQKALSASGYQLTIASQSAIGAQYGGELIDSGLYALILVMVGIMIYLSIRFEWKLALGAVVALAHDLTITLGFFSLTQMSFDLNVLAALLAVLGYSVNDTVVVFDRIRENFIRIHEGDERFMTNRAINQTMSRTLITSLTTLLSVVALAIFGGPILFGFSIALIVGIAIGTYSSIFVASALAIRLQLAKSDLIPKKPEDYDDRP